MPADNVERRFKRNTMENIIDDAKVKALESLLLESNKNLVEAMYGFKEPELNKVPFEGSWTGGQVCSHVIKCLEFNHQFLNDTSEATKRSLEQHVPALKEMMEDMSAKAQSAPILLPDNTVITRTDISKLLTDGEEKLLYDIRSLDLSSTCTANEFPGIGYVTRYELISFTAFHTKRHAIQLKNIHQVLTSSGN